MPRAKLIRTDRLAYHVTVRSNNKEWFYIPLEECWRILTDALASSAERYGAQVHHLVLMSNHFHLLISTPNLNLDLVMQYFESQATRWIQYRTQRINHVFGGRYKWNVLPDATALAYVYKYISRNPVRAGITVKCEQYSHSAVNAVKCSLALSEGFDEYWRAIPKSPEKRRAWLNLPTPKEAEGAIKTGLKHPTFRLPKGNDHRKQIKILHQMYGVHALENAKFLKVD